MKNSDIKKTNDNPEIAKHYDALNKMGLWDYFEKLNMNVKLLEELNKEAAEIFNKRSIMELVDYVTSRLLNKLLPSYMAFVIQEESNGSVPQLICFKNMRLSKKLIDIEALEPYKDFFTEFPNSIEFSLFEYKMDNKKLTDPLLPISPEIVVPIIGLGGFYGFIVFGEKVIGKGYTRHEIAYLDRLMKFTSISLQNNINYKNAITDYKTKLYNHSFFTRRLYEELARAKRYKMQLTLLILDIDHFKKFNDTYGHLLGDEVLFQISRMLEKSIRKEDIAARFGGEEFVVILVQTGRDSGWIAAERIRKSIENMKIKYADTELNITVSIGAASLSGDNLVCSTYLLEQADTALYKSKEGGRNKTTFYNPGLCFIAEHM